MVIHSEDSFVFISNKNMHTCVILKPCEITNMIYFFFVLGGHYPLFLEVDGDEKE